MVSLGSPSRPGTLIPASDKELVAAVPAYRVHKAKRLGYVRISGRMIYLGRAGSAESQESYRRVLAEWLATGHVPQRRIAPLTAQDATVSNVVEAYLNWARHYYVDSHGRPSPGLGPVEAVARPLRQLYGFTQAAAFGPVALRAVRQEMVQAGLCRNVVNQRVACVKRIFRWGVAEELVPAAVLTALIAVEPLRKGRSAVRETKPVRPVADAHVEAVLPFLPPTLQAMVRLQRLTGMRSGEVCCVRTADVNTTAPVWIYRPASHKTAYREHDRIVWIGPQAQAVLQPFLRPDQLEAYVFSPVAAERERCTRPELVRRSTGVGILATDDRPWRKYNPRSYHRALRYAMRTGTAVGCLARKDYWHPHQLRHRHATAVREARGLEAARVLLGHRSITQTLDYAEADAAVAKSLASELG